MLRRNEILVNEIDTQRERAKEDEGEKQQQKKKLVHNQDYPRFSFYADTLSISFFFLSFLYLSLSSFRFIYI